MSRGWDVGVLGAITVLTGACGAKSQLRTWDASPFQPECVTDDTCDDGIYCNGVETCRQGRCTGGAPIVCTDGDPCTLDTCNEMTRTCDHAPATPDADGDGYRAPLPGHQAGDPGSCGNDCNDMNPDVHPGAPEVCNGIDDNCNGLIDEGATYTPHGPDVAVSDPDSVPATTGGLSYSGAQYLATYSGYTNNKSHVYFSALDQLGNRVSTPPQRQLTLTPSDAFGAAVAWNGYALGAVWQDRPEGNYEIYFNLLTPNGERLGPDQRVTFASGFSINPSITWTGTEFLLAWQDERDAVGTGEYSIYVQRIDGMGRQIEDNHRITTSPSASESPSIAYGNGAVGIAWIDGRDGPMTDPEHSHVLYFVSLTPDLHRMTTDLRVTDVSFNAVSPVLVWNRDRWVMAVHDGDPASLDHQVWGAERDIGGGVLLTPTRLTNSTGFARYPALIPLGDRLVLVWADDRDDNTGYEIYASLLDANTLARQTPEMRVTDAVRDSVFPAISLGVGGDVGILFSDQREGPWRTRFTRLECAIP